MKHSNLQDHLQATKMYDWLVSDALPLWSTTGINPETNICYEALTHQGDPIKGAVRLRVLARQSYCFSKTSNFPGAPKHLLEISSKLFQWIMHHGFNEFDCLAQNIDENGMPMDGPHDLYDLSFVYLSAAALIEQGQNLDVELSKLDRSLEKLKAPKGWFETIGQALPRRQNPHMHLFEAMTELYLVTKREKYLRVARCCLNLFLETFLQPDGAVFEYYDRELRSLEVTHQIEPGHISEWIWLLDRYQKVTGQHVNVNTSKMWNSVSGGKLENGLLPNKSDPISGSGRLWCQTEHLRAAIVVDCKKKTRFSDAIALNIWSNFVEKDVFPGGWVDECTSSGQSISADMPSSSLYHIVGATIAYINLKGLEVING